VVTIFRNCLRHNSLKNFTIAKIAKASQNISMEPLKLPAEEEIRAAIRQGEEETVALIGILLQIIATQAVRIQALKIN
jgi:hypothetical protein